MPDIKTVPAITNIPSGLKDASNVELLETGLTLYVDNWINRDYKSTSEGLNNVYNCYSLVMENIMTKLLSVGGG